MNTNIIKKDNWLNGDKSLENLYEIQEYYLKKGDNNYKIIIGKSKNLIIIKYENYIIDLDYHKLPKKFTYNINSTDKAYKFINKLFNEDKVIIKDIIINKELKLILNISNENNENEFEITLLYKNELKNNYNSMKKKDNINKNKNNNIQKNNKLFKENIIKFDLTNDAFNSYASDNTFSAFKSINEIFYLVYGNKSKSIIFYNLIDLKKINEIKNAHNYYITNIRYYLDITNKRDLIISISANDNNLKLWNVNSFECLTNIKNINKDGYLNSACLLNNNNQIYIITSNFYYYSFEPIKIFDLNGNKIKELNNSNDKTYFIESYYDIKLSKNFIITGNIGYVKTYDYNENIIYNKYTEDNNKRLHYNIIINNIDKITKLIESCADGNIRIWDFHSSELLNKIKVSNCGLNSIFLINNDYLFVGCDEKKVKQINLKDGVVKNLIGLDQNITTIKLISHPKYDKCLIAQGRENYQIKMWVIKI